MRWSKEDKSRNIEDRRGKKASRGGGIGIGAIIFLVILYFLGGDALGLLQGGGMSDNSGYQETSNYNPNVSGVQTTADRNEDELAEFVESVLVRTEEVWAKVFREQLGARYQEPGLVLFNEFDQSACGYAKKATGPFYCPADHKAYIDLDFYQELNRKFKAPGDFAMAYVIAHEIGHHVQNLMGTTGEVQSAKRRLSEKDGNKLSVRLELQADYYAGVWAHHANKMRNILEEGDIEEALTAASAIGDDRIQKQAQGYVVPDAFTHGTSEQRMKWFIKGFQSGDLRGGDTFSIADYEL